MIMVKVHIQRRLNFAISKMGSMLKVPDHQVAGHSARNGQLGPLIDGSGCFYKPIQSNDRGSREISFYRSLSRNPRVPTHILRYFPSFYDTQMAQASDGSGLLPHLVLEDVTADLLHPSIIDIKVGSRTWYPGASESYIHKCWQKDGNSTSVPLGFRISGLQVSECGGKLWKPSKENIKSFQVEEVRSALRKFVSSNPTSDMHPDCFFASMAYGTASGLLEQLLELKHWFEDQTWFHFFSTSVLLMMEVDKGRVRTKAKLVDFAHVLEGNGVIDHNFLGGLCSLIKFISNIVNEASPHVAHGHSYGSGSRTCMCKIGENGGHHHGNPLEL